MMPKFFRWIVVVLIMAMLATSLGGCSKATATTAATTAATAAATAQPTKQDLQGNITISGAFALYPMMQLWAQEFQKVYPNVKFDISAGGAGKGMTDTLAGAVDIGMISRAISSDEEAKGAYWVGVVKDAVFPDVSDKNPVLQDLMSKGLKKGVFIGIYITGDIKTWGQAVGRPEVTDEIHAYSRSDSSGALDVWALYLGKKAENVLGIGVNGDPGLLDAVIKDPLGIGFNNLGYAFDLKTNKPVAGAVIVPIDYNENGKADPEEVMDTMTKATDAVATGKYPSPPARILNLATKGKPTGVVQAFISWILTDGQQFVGQAGYVQLTQDQLEASQQKIH